MHTNTLFPGESVGDLDVLDGALHAVPSLDSSHADQSRAPMCCRSAVITGLVDDQ